MPSWAPNAADLPQEIIDSVGVSRQQSESGTGDRKLHCLKQIQQAPHIFQINLTMGKEEFKCFRSSFQRVAETEGDYTEQFQ